MTTRSYIGYEENGFYTYIYCHSDGYYEHNGVVLKENYDTLEKVKELVSFGDASSIAESIDKCCFYCRDRKEPFEDVAPKTDRSMPNDEISYLFKGGKWVYKNS